MVAVHLAANTKGDLPREKEGPDGRREELRVIQRILALLEGPFVLLGDLNVRQEEVQDLLEAGEWRDAAYAGRSFEPRQNDFTGEVMKSGRGASAPGHRFDRFWFKGALWVQAYLTGTCRRFSEGRPYCLSDHYAVYGLMDVHACHGVRGVRVVREQRRMDLGKLRDAGNSRLKEFVRRQEQASKEADWAAQQRVSEERLQEAVREKRKAVKDRRERRAKLREQINGEGTLFATSVDGLFRSRCAVPMAPADHAIDLYVGLVGAGFGTTWQAGCHGWPQLGGYSSVVRAVECTV